mgnify:CR=1 FL=1
MPKVVLAICVLPGGREPSSSDRQNLPGSNGQNL